MWRVSFDYILTLETILFWICEQKYLCLHFCYNAPPLSSVLRFVAADIDVFIV